MFAYFSTFTPGTNTQVGDVIVGLRGGINTQFTFPSTGINDSNGNLLLGWTSPGTLATPAVNTLQFASSVSGANPLLSPLGSDLNLGINIKTLGTGMLNVLGTQGLVIPCGTEAQRLPVGVPGLIRINSDTGYIEWWNNTANQYEDATGALPTPVSLQDGGTGSSLVALNNSVFVINNSGVTILSTTPGSQILGLSFAATPVNYIQIKNAATTASPGFNAVGTDANIGFSFTPAGTGVFSIASTNYMQIPCGTTVQRQAGVNGALRSNTDTGLLEYYNSVTGQWSTTNEMEWKTITSATTLVPGNGYFANNAGTITFTLPTTSVVGDTYEVAAMTAAGWKIAQSAAGQSIQMGNVVTTVGATGYITSAATGNPSTAIGAWIQIVCNVANTSFMANMKAGNCNIF